jgi:hypothetical protein
MPSSLVLRAIEQAKEHDSPLRAMALLYGSRVLAAVDKDAAKRAFGEGVAVAEGLQLDPHTQAHLMDDAVRIGATADPLAAVALFRRLPQKDPGAPHRTSAVHLIQSLAKSGDFETALALLEDQRYDTEGEAAVVQLATDPIVQRRAMFAARERWRALLHSPDRTHDPFASNQFYHLVSNHLTKLESAEQQSWLDEILLALESTPETPGGFRFGEHVQLHNTRDAYLFFILNVLRKLKPPEQVEAILKAHPNVAEAAKIYPLGLESLKGQQRPAGQTNDRPSGIGMGGAGSGRNLQQMDVMLATHHGDASAIQRLLVEAHEFYRADTDAVEPNRAPRVFWPSCHAYKVALYFAGKSMDQDAEPLLGEIPDSGFALLASIELAAGALGVPTHFGVRMTHRR